MGSWFRVISSLARTLFDLMQGRLAAGTPMDPQDRYREVVRSPDAQADAVRAIEGLSESARLPRLRALFVEDNVDLQEQIGWMLEVEGLDFVTCASPRRGG